MPPKKRKTTRKKVRTPTQQRSRKTVEAILEATARVLVERGYAGTTTNHIAKRAGVSVASFYEYFEDKDAAIAALAERMIEQGMKLGVQYGEEILGLQPLEALRVLLLKVVDLASANAPLLRTLYQEVPFVWQLPKVRGIVSQIVDLGMGYAFQQQFVPPEEVTEDRLYLATVIAGAVITQVATDPSVKKRREALIGELIAMFGYYYRGIVTNADPQRISASN